jgi:hypothetical protein
MTLEEIENILAEHEDETGDLFVKDAALGLVAIEYLDRFNHTVRVLSSNALKEYFNAPDEEGRKAILDDTKNFLTLSTNEIVDFHPVQPSPGLPKFSFRF